MKVLSFAELLTPSTLVVAVDGRRACLTASRGGAQELARQGQATFTPLEYEAGFLGLQESRAAGSDFCRWIDAKLRNPAWRLPAEEAVAGAIGLLDGERLLDRHGRPYRCTWRARAGALRWTWGEALRAIGGELVDAWVEGEAVEAAAEGEAAE